MTHLVVSTSPDSPQAVGHPHGRAGTGTRGAGTEQDSRDGDTPSAVFRVRIPSQAAIVPPSPMSAGNSTIVARPVPEAYGTPPGVSTIVNRCCRHLWLIRSRTPGCAQL